MKKLVMFLAELLTLNMLLTGCYSYKDLNRVVFATSVVIDEDGAGNPILYIEAFQPVRMSNKESGKGERLLFRSTGKTIFEAIRDADVSTSYKINFTQNKAVIFTKRAAESGIDKYMDIFDRSVEFIIRQYVYVYLGDVQRLLNAKLKDNQYIGLYLVDLIHNEAGTPRTVEKNINDYFNQRLLGSGVSLVTVIDLKGQQLEDKLEVNGAVVLKHDKYADYLPKNAGMKYNLLTNKLSAGSLEVDNPDSKKAFITLEISSSNTNTKLVYGNDKITLYKNIDVRVSLLEAQKAFTASEESLNKLKSIAEYNVKSLCTDFFNEYKKKGLDIFCIQEEFQRRYPKEKPIPDIIKKTELVLLVNIQIQDTVATQDF